MSSTPSTTEAGPNKTSNGHSANGPSARSGRRGRGRQGGPGRGEPRSGDGDSRSQETGDRQRHRQRGGRAGGLPRANGHGPSATTTPSAPNAAVTSTTGGPQNDDDDVEAEVCFICASPVVHNSVAPCNHRTCHICALRLRALYKTKTCAHCRTNAETVIFTDDATKRFEDFQQADFSSQDPNLGINYEKQEIFEDTVLLLRYNCPDSSCDVACLGWPDLHRHVKSVHHKVMCDLCTRNKKVFTHEHELFTQQDLRKHERFGDDHPGAVDQSGFKGHPECGFCRQRFYGDDELFAHCRDKHEKCHVCDRANEGRNPQYYVNYDALEAHFRKDHYICPDQECLEKKFVVFGSEMDLKAHQLEAHPNGLTKGRDARRVDMSGFDYRSPHQQERERPRREGRGRGRGRDPNAEPLPPSSAQPLRRDELAYQRQMAIQSAQSVTARTFGGQLTQPASQAPSQQPATSAPSTVTVAPSHPQMLSLDPLSLDPSPNATLSPQDHARRLRHAAVAERAAALLKNDVAKVAEFRTHVSSYRAGTTTAPQLVDSFFALFESTASTAELGTLVKELADVLDLPRKRDELLRAWADWRAINEDYPVLPGPTSNGGSASRAGGAASWASLGGSGTTGSANPAPSSTGGARVLKLKSSTARSGLTASRNAAASPGNPFPPLGTGPLKSNARASVPGWLGAATSSGSAAAAQSSKVLTVPHASISAVHHPASSSARASPAPSGTGPSARRAAAGHEFPSLPKALKPVSSVFSPGYTGAGVRRTHSPAVGSGQASAWGGGAQGISGAGSGSSSVSASGAATPVEGGGGVDGVGKRKGKKVLLYNWG